MSWLTDLKAWFARRGSSASTRAYFDDDANWLDVTTSSNVAGISFCIDICKGAASVGTLGIRFLNRTWYYYDNVPVSVWTGMIAAPSRGKYLDRQVKKAGYTYHGPQSW